MYSFQRKINIGDLVALDESMLFATRNRYIDRAGLVIEIERGFYQNTELYEHEAVEVAHQPMQIDRIRVLWSLPGTSSFKSITT